eukprot:XP_011606888.1 PREDICTED: E3 ubiquitin-protein ligase TRIM13 isoform X3 [Takifugu rubripes]
MIALRCASQQLDTMEQLEEELTCPICCGLFEDPRVLLCSHSFCKKCLEGLLEGSRGSTFRTPFKCPTCRKEAPHNGANSLQINYSLRGIVEKYSKIKVLPKMSECKHHCGQPLNIFCATDLKLICGFCATTDDHRGHKFCSMEEAYDREKEAFDELCQRVENWQSADILTHLDTLQTSKKKALQSVTSDAEKAYDPEITKLSAVMEEHRRALGIAESFRGITEPLFFLQQMQEFREKVELLKKTLLPSRKNISVRPLVRNFDVKKWDSLRLREVDKISVPHESGSYRTEGSRVSARTWMRPLIAMLLITLPFLLPLTVDVPPHVEPVVAALSAHLGHAGAYLRQINDACTSLTDACEARFAALVDATVRFIGGLF